MHWYKTEVGRSPEGFGIEGRVKIAEKRPEERGAGVYRDPSSTPIQGVKCWVHFIQKVYETDPLLCPKCKGTMRNLRVS